MNTGNDFTLARSRYLQQIATKRAEINELENKIKLLEEIISENGAARDFISDVPIIDHQKYSKMGLSEAALDALRNLRLTHVKDTTKTRVAKYMMDMGFKPSGKNFGISVDTALRRAVDSGKIASTLKNGHRIYTLTPGEEELL